MGGFSTVTPSAQNATAVAQAVWSYTPRSLTDIQSLVSAIQNNDPSLLSTPSDLMYVPAPYYAGQVSATQVAAFLDNLVLNYGLAGPVAAAISASPYGLWSTNFVTQVLPYLDVTSLNLLLSSGQMDANHAQLILYWLAQNYYYNKWVYTVTANATSITFSNNVTLNANVLVAQNITIASGVTVTCGTTTCFFIAQVFNNQGSIVNPIGAAGGLAGSGNGPGGIGGGGVVIIAVTAVLGTVNVSGNTGGSRSGVPQGVPGSIGAAGVFYVVGGATVPLGGTGGGGVNVAGYPGYNGGGGGGTTYAGGAGGSASVYSFSSPNAMLTYILQGLSDWWITSAVGRSPIYAMPLAYMYGSGGGGGGYSGGGGGGGGGEVVVYGYNIVSGSINAVGGPGGGGPPGGGGGGGGLVFVFYGATSGSVTANITGGAGSGGGAAGANGTAYIAQVTVNG